MITFELFPGVGDVLEKRRFTVELGGGTLKGAIQALVEAYPELGDDILDADKTLRLTLATFVNDERVPNDTVDHYNLKDGDRITILSPISGG